TISGLVIAQRVVKTKRGDNMAIITLDDRTGRMDITLFAEVFNAARDVLLKDGLLVISGQVRYDDFSGMLKMSADSIRLLADVRQEKVRELWLELDSGSLSANFARELKDMLEPYRQSPQQDARCAIVAEYCRSDARAQLRFGQQWNIRPEDELLQRLRDSPGRTNVKLVYSTSVQMEC